MYAILDIETTGLSPRREKIIEIAIFKHDGKQIIDKLHCLLNPERMIPAYITQITGITTQMIEDAPTFYEVAKDIVNFTEDCIVVGHNVHFDFGFIKEEFRALGFEYSRKTLDTLKLSRRFFPGHPSYSLPKLCKLLGINNREEHRAAGDALATVRLFEMLLDKDPLQGGGFTDISALPFKDLHPALKKESLEKLPSQVGLYYFFDDKGELIYIGKSKNIAKRVADHLRNTKTPKASEMRQRIADVYFELTGSELIALLKEDAQIKKNKPFFNRAQKRSFFTHGIYFYHDNNGYIRFKTGKTNNGDIPLATFASARTVKAHLEQLVDKFELCQKLAGTYSSQNACFYYTIRQCRGACVGEESPDLYNLRATAAIESFEFDKKDFYLIDKGRNLHEKSVIAVENGKYLGFGFFNEQDFNGNSTELKNFITPLEDNRDIQLILKLFIRKGKYMKMVHTI